VTVRDMVRTLPPWYVTVLTMVRTVSQGMSERGGLLRKEPLRPSYMGIAPLSIRSFIRLCMRDGATLRRQSAHPSHLRGLLGGECASPMGFLRAEPGGHARCTSARREAAVMLLEVRE